MSTKTKSVTVQVCDNCGAERRLNGPPVVCLLCHKEGCDDCCETFHTEISRHRSSLFEGQRGGPARSYSSFRVGFKHNGKYCTQCSVEVVKALRALHLIESVAEWNGAVGD